MLLQLLGVFPIRTFALMSRAETLARAEHSLRPLLSYLPSTVATKLFSFGRSYFIDRFASDAIEPRTPQSAGVTAWGLHFQMPIWNAAGMFKKGEAYGVVSKQGAGAYVAGTTTSRIRTGNTKNGVTWPAVPYGSSKSSSNWMGLPNDGHRSVAAKLASLERVYGCPVGASVSAEPGLSENEALPELVDGLQEYDRAKVDYIELNESCPNVPGTDHGRGIDDDLIRRLEFVSERFLAKRQRHLPVVVKFSNDTNPDQLNELLRTLVTLNFDGVILGNTSTKYVEKRTLISVKDRSLYDSFCKTFGGGLSGAVLTDDSLALAARAVQEIDLLQPRKEFKVIRCGGVFDHADVKKSAEVGVHLHQWYTGYFEAFSRVGHNVYVELAKSLASNLA